MAAKGRDDGLLRLSDVARAAGVSNQTVQYYLMIGLLTETSRTEGGHRLFDAETVRRVKLIHKLNNSGYALRDIKETFFARWTEQH